MTCPKEHTVGKLYVSTHPCFMPMMNKIAPGIWKPTDSTHEIKANVPMLLLDIPAVPKYIGIFLYEDQLVEIPWEYVFPVRQEEP